MFISFLCIGKTHKKKANSFVQSIFRVLCGMIADMALFLRFFVFFQCKQNK